MAMVEDLAVFFNTDEFAISALYNGSTTVKVIYDHEYTEQFGAAGTNPFITAKAVDFANAAKGQSVVLDSTSYTIKTIERDGTGLVRLELTKAA